VIGKGPHYHFGGGGGFDQERENDILCDKKRISKKKMLQMVFQATKGTPFIRARKRKKKNLGVIGGYIITSSRKSSNPGIFKE